MDNVYTGCPGNTLLTQELMAKLVMIHGRGQRKQNHEELRQIWIAALKSGLAACSLPIPEGTEIVLPFYGVELDQIRKEDSPDQLQAKGEEGEEFTPLHLELLQELASNAGITEQELQQEMEPGLIARGFRNTALGLAIARALDNKYTGDLSLGMLTKDVLDYLTKPFITQSINNIVLREVGAGPCVVVGHSLGSVIGYNILAEHAEDLDVQAYITVGSPLGLRSMGTHIYSPLTMPKCIRDRWFNAYDRKDIVALKPLTRQ
jgi:hypothetical protein